jgi:hypothetical protein
MDALTPVTDINVHKIVVTTFRDQLAKECERQHWSLPEMRDIVLRTCADTKKKLPWLKCVEFGEKKTDKGSLRHDANVVSVSGVELDYDAKLISIEEVVARLEKLGVRALVYTSPSNTKTEFKWRVVAPLSKEQPPKGREKYAKRLASAIGINFDRASFTLSQSFYYGRALDNDNVDHKAFVVDGDFIDLRDDLAQFDSTVTHSKPNGEKLDKKKKSGFEYHLSRMGDGAGLEGFNGPLNSATAAFAQLHRTNFDRDKLKEKLRTAIRAAPKKPDRKPGEIERYLSDEYLNDLIRTAVEKFGSAHDETIAHLNEKHAMVLLGNKTAILREEGGEISFLSVSAFDQWFANQHVVIHDRRMPVAKQWMTHPHRRQYSGVVFDPTRLEVPGKYNLWRGFSVEPKEGDCSKFLSHVKENICCNDEETYRWVMAWMADMVQNPGSKPGVALVLRGKQGTGKTKFGEVLGSLLGPHYALVADPRFVTGRFNSHLKACLLLHSDEGFWAGDHTAEGKLKDLVTGHEQWIELKGFEAVRIPNYIRLLTCSNQDWVVPAGLDERRFATLDVGDAHIQDHDYFAAIDAEMKNGGREALLHYLQNFDLKQVDLRQIPRTKALLDQKINSLDPQQAWWLDVLARGELPWGCDYRRECATEKLFNTYVSHAMRQGVRRRTIETQLGIFLKKYVPNLKRNLRGQYQTWTAADKVKHVDGPTYEFPPLKDCRAEFERLTQQQFPWDDKGDWTHAPSPEVEEKWI